MAPRRRKPENTGLPPYLYRHPKRPGWRLYNPVTGRESYLADARYSKAQAFAEAAKVGEQAKAKRLDSVAVLVPQYLRYLELGNNKPSTLRVKASILNSYVRRVGRFRVASITRSVLQEHWETIGPDGWAKHRSIWVGFLHWCQAHGHVVRNEAELTLKPPPSKRVTRRHTTDGVAAIHATADPWLRIAIDLAVYSLQDRSTLAVAKRDDVRKVAGGFEWDSTRLKTDSPMTIRVPAGTRLYAALDAALRFPIVGSYLIRRDPKRKARAVDREEWSQVMPDQISKAFAAARLEAEPYPHYSNPEQPGFHQLRAYGSWLYKQAGFSAEYVQALMAHESVAMTEHYQDGHGDAVKREIVEAGL